MGLKNLISDTKTQYVKKEIKGTSNNYQLIHL